MTNEIDRIGREIHFRLRFGHELHIVSHGKTPRQSCPGLPQFSQRAAHITVPNWLPIPAVTAIASAPLNAARIAPMMVRAPPARAASAPRNASNTTDAPHRGNQMHIRNDGSDQQRYGRCDCEAGGRCKCRLRSNRPDPHPRPFCSAPHPTGCIGVFPCPRGRGLASRPPSRPSPARAVM